MMQFMEKHVAPWATRIASHKLLSAISNGFNMILPIIIVGALFSLLVGLNVDAYQGFLAATGIGPVIAIIPQITTNLMALYAVFAITYQYAINKGHRDDAVMVGVFGLFMFFVITPITPTELVSGLTGAVDIPVFTFDWFGGTGLFSAILVAAIVVNVYAFVIRKGWIIRMPDGVPPTVAKSFSALIPVFLLTILGLVLNYVLALTPFENLHQVIYGLVLLPLGALSNNLFSMILLLLLMHLFWLFGMHGTMIMGPVLLSILMPATTENMTALAQGAAIPNTFSLGFISVIALGGIGSTLPLLVAMVRAKSQRYKTLTRLSVVPSIFGINEPVIFGFPIVLNPTMFIPFMVVPIVNALILFVAIKINFVSPPALMQLPTGTPIFVDGFLQMGVNGILIQAVMFVVDTIIYYPFGRFADKQEYLLEENV